MATPWVDRIVELIGKVSTGRMRVVEVDGAWVGCVPIDEDTTVYRLAKGTGDGVLWVRKRDIRECTQEETLL